MSACLPVCILTLFESMQAYFLTRQIIISSVCLSVYLFVPLCFFLLCLCSCCSCSNHILAEECIKKLGCVPLRAAADADSISAGIMIAGWEGED